MYLIFDTETTGLPRNWRAPITDLDNWPRLVQLAWQLHDRNGNSIERGDFIVKPEGFIVPTDASRIHGITHERALEEGIALADALQKFEVALANSEYLMAHNMSYDEKIIGAEFLRNNKKNFLETKKKICTMESATNFCAIPSPRGGFKWPNLGELHQKLFNQGFMGAHNAATDVSATAKCFFELKRQGVVVIDESRVVPGTPTQASLF